MSEITKEIAYLVDMLPAQDQNLAYELVKKMVLAWDADFTKLTPLERQRLDIAEMEINNGDFVTHDSIDW